ncbi:MAG: SPASM domain-containing protein [Bacilli bacterium]|nr:SPASM domain-containing protein [Bacilli bacterium]
MYKKVYLEITNNCNLNCSFCIKNNRDKKFITMDEYKIVLDKLKDYTKYLYFHVSGEPLLHPNINDLINLASSNFQINITTNGYLIKRIKDNHNIRQINISLHSFSNKYNITLESYMEDIFDVIDSLKKDTYFSLRFWVNNEFNSKIIEMINDRYNVNLELQTGFKITDNVFVSVNKEFIWPDLNNDYYNEDGTCYALKDHIGILVNGDVVPCCLDANGVIKLGNIYEDDLNEIINGDRYKKMLEGFKNNKKCEELCKKCNFLE